MSDRVTVDISQGVADVRLNRGDKMNAMDGAMFDCLVETADSLAGDPTVRAVVLDQTQCGFFPTRPAKYNYFREVRPSVAELGPGLTWRDCNLDQTITGIKGGLTLSQGAMASDVGDDGWVARQFRLIVETATGDFTCEAPAEEF